MTDLEKQKKNALAELKATQTQDFKLRYPKDYKKRQLKAAKKYQELVSK